MINFVLLAFSINLINSINNSSEEKPNFITFPFTTKIKSYPREKVNPSYNENDFIKDYLNNTIYINMTIGNPIQNIKMMLDPNDNCFTFKRSSEIMKQNSMYYNKENYTQVTPYNKTASYTAKKGSVTYFDFNSEFNDLYDMEDEFYLYKYSDIKNATIKNTSTILRFLYGNIKGQEEVVYGKIGLDMNNYEESSCPRFFYSLGLKNIVKKYIYYFDFYSYFHGYFILGPEPHLFNKKNNLNKEYQYIKMNTVLSKEGYIHWNLLFNKIIMKNRHDDYVYNFNEKMAQIDFNLGLIIGTYEFQQEIEKLFFNALIAENICKKTLVEYSYYKDNIKKYYVYKCDKSFMSGENFDKEKYRPYISYFELFPDFQFFHINFEHEFYISNFHLFKFIQGNYYFMVIFEAETQNKVWKLGQIFLKDHQLFFDYDSKALGYYDKRIGPVKNDTERKSSNNSNSEDKIYSNNNKDYKYIIYIALFVVFCAIVFIAFYLGMKVKESRKKRANELKDDDYDYETYDNNKNSINNNIINNES